MGSDHYFHPEFGWLAPASRLRRELRVGFFSMLFGLSIGAVAVGALSVGSRDAGTNSVSPVASRGVVAPLITTEALPTSGSGNKRPEAAGIIIDQARTKNEGSTRDAIKPDTASTQAGNSGRKNAKTACDVNKSGCLENARRASVRGGVGSPAANDGPAIARVPLGRAEASTGIQGSGRSDVAAQVSLAPERTKPPALQQDLATKDRSNSKAMSRVGRADVRDSSSSPLGFWDWSR